MLQSKTQKRLLNVLNIFLILIPLEVKVGEVLSTTDFELPQAVDDPVETELLWLKDTGFLWTVVASDVDWDIDTIGSCTGCVGNPPGNIMEPIIGSKTGMIISALQVKSMNSSM